MDIIKAQQNSWQKWEEHISSGFQLYPSEWLTRYVASRRKDIKTIMDFGCGDGRNAEMMARFGIAKIIITDINQNALNITKERLSGYKSECLAIKVDENMQVATELADLVICWGTMHLNTAQTAQKMLNAFNVALKPSGKCVASWRTRYDSLYKAGEKIAEDTYIIKEKAHDGMLYYFPNLATITKLYQNAGFKIINIDKEQYSLNGESVVNSWHIIEARKD